MAVVERVTASEFRQHFGKYMELVGERDFEVTRNGKVVAVWSNPRKRKLDAVERLAGSIGAEIDEASLREERRAAL